MCVVKKSLPTTQRINFISITKTSYLMLFLARITITIIRTIYMYIKIYRTAVLPVVLYGCEAWSLTLRKGHRLRVIKSRRMRWVGHEARMGDRRGPYRVLVASPEGKQPLGRPRRRWVANIKNGSSRSGKRRKGMDCCDSGQRQGGGLL